MRSTEGARGGSTKTRCSTPSLELAARIARLPPATLLDPKRDFVSDNGLFRYVLRGAPRSSAAGASVREQLKDLYDRPYLPGTSLKGALRTALAWVGWGELGLRPDRRELVPNPRFAARNYERRILGRDPNHDLLRALHVGDSAPVEAENLILVNAQVLHQSGALGSPIELEAIRPETAFRLPLKIDLALFSAWAGRNRLQHANWLRDLPAVVRRHTAQRLDQEVSWFGPVGNARLIADLYRQLKSVRLPNRAFLLQVGWGTGWDDKTFGSHLREDEAFMEGILAPRRSGGYGIARGNRRPGDPFPKSRRVLVDAGGRPQSPLGWVVVEMLCRESIQDRPRVRSENPSPSRATVRGLPPSKRHLRCLAESKSRPPHPRRLPKMSRRRPPVRHKSNRRLRCPPNPKRLARRQSRRNLPSRRVSTWPGWCGTTWHRQRGRSASTMAQRSRSAGSSFGAECATCPQTAACRSPS